MKKIEIEVDEGMYKVLERYAKRKGITVEQYAFRCVLSYLLILYFLEEEKSLKKEEEKKNV